MLSNILKIIIHRLSHIWLFVLIVIPTKSFAESQGIYTQLDMKDAVPQSVVRILSDEPTGDGPLEFQLNGLVELDVENHTNYANPFDPQEIELRVTFIHEDTGEEVQFIGFYDGDGQGNLEGDKWKIRFMPHKTGLWSYTYSWSDGSAGNEGSFSVVDSEFPDVIGPDSENPKIWRLTEKDNQIPFYIAVSNTYFDTIDDPDTDLFLDYVKYSLGAKGIAVNLTNRVWLDCQETTSCSPTELQFSLINWHALDKYVAKLRQRELGLNLMFYLDDQEKPRFPGESKMEEMLLQYTIARIGAFPLLSFDSGIDINEYRSPTWHNWFATRILELDPWDHPVGSRHGGGSGDFTCDSCTYDALGDVHPTYAEFLQSMSDTQKPLFYTDRWREDYRRGDFDRDSIRKIAWHASLSGGAGFVIGGIHNGLELFDYETDLDAPWQLKAFSDFWHGRIRQWSTFITCNEMLRVGLCLGEAGEEYVVYLENGEETLIELPLGKSDYLGTWLNPRSGEYYDVNPMEGGETIAISPPQADQGDWVLHLYQESVPVVADAEFTFHLFVPFASR